MATHLLLLSHLPHDLLHWIFKYLDYKDLVSCSETCRRLNELCNYDHYWKTYYRRYWDENYVPQGTTWRDSFVEEYRDKNNYIGIYKGVKKAWGIIKNTMEKLEPKIVSSLYEGLTEEELDAFEKKNDISIPADVRCVYRFHGGQNMTEGKNGIFGLVQNYSYFKTEHLMPLSITTNHLKTPCIIVTGDQNSQLLCLLEDTRNVRAGTIITPSPPVPQSYLVLASNFLEYFLGYAKKLEENYFPIIQNRIYRFYKDPKAVALSHDVEIQVSTAFLHELDNDFFVHAYLVQFSMDKKVPRKMSCQLERRHWDITEDGQTNVVEGPGIIGKTPIFEPGSEFSYISSTKSRFMKSSMKGYYTVRNLASGERYNVTIPEFHLDSGCIVNFDS